MSSVSATSTEDPRTGAETLSEQQLTVCRGFIKACLERLRESLEMLLGQPMAIELQEAVVESDIAIRIRMPASGGACTMKASVDGMISFLMMEPPLVQNLLALIKILPKQEVLKAREQAADLTQEDRTDLEEVCSFFAAAFNDEAQERTDGAMGFEASRVLAIADSSWVDGEDPVSAIPYITLTGTMSIGGEGPADPFNLLIPEETLGRILPEFARADPAEAAAESTWEHEAPQEHEPPTPPPAEEAAPPEDHTAEAPKELVEEAHEPVERSPEPVLRVAEEQFPPVDGLHGGTLCLCPEGVDELVETSLPGSKVLVRKPSMLLQQLESEASPELLVAYVGTQDLHVLKLLTALRVHPALQGRPILVLLDDPTRRRVLICGQLGLWNVLPVGTPAGVVKARCEHLLAG